MFTFPEQVLSPKLCVVQMEEAAVIRKQQGLLSSIPSVINFSGYMFNFPSWHKACLPVLVSGSGFHSWSMATSYKLREDFSARGQELLFCFFFLQVLCSEAFAEFGIYGKGFQPVFVYPLRLYPFREVSAHAVTVIFSQNCHCTKHKRSSSFL